MTLSASRVLWLHGPPGVGKTAVAWEYFSQLTQAGLAVGYVDIDQLGICYPEPAADPGRHQMKTQNLGKVIATFAAAGTPSVVVSGAVDPRDRAHPELPSEAALTLGRLMAAGDVISQRLAARDGTFDGVDDALRDADRLDASDFADFCVDTTALTIPEVVELVREHSRGWPLGAGVTGGPPRAAGGPSTGAAAREPRETFRQLGAAGAARVLLICGPTAVGKSTVGWEVCARLRRTGLTAAYLDLDQIGFCRPAAPDDPGNHRVKSRNLAAIWTTYRAAGAQCLVAVGQVDDADTAQAYADALPGAAMTLCRLHAGPGELIRRILRRGQGAGSWAQPGDPLIGKSIAELYRIAVEAAATAGTTERAGPGELRIDTDGRTAAAAADDVVTQLRWPGLLR